MLTIEVAGPSALATAAFVVVQLGLILVGLVAISVTRQTVAEIRETDPLAELLRESI